MKVLVEAVKMCEASRVLAEALRVLLKVVLVLESSRECPKNVNSRRVISVGR